MELECTDVLSSVGYKYECIAVMEGGSKIGPDRYKITPSLHLYAPCG